MGASEAFSSNKTELVSVVGARASINTSAIDVRANTQGGTAVETKTRGTMSEIRTREPMLGLVRRSTPINVNRLEISLTDHPERIFVYNLLQIFKLEANIGFFGQRSPRLSKNLPTALAQPDIGQFR